MTVSEMYNMQELWVQSELTMTRESWTTTARREFGTTNAWWNRTMRHSTTMTTWKPRQTQSTWNATLDKWMCTKSSCYFVLYLRPHTHSLHTTSRGSSFAFLSHLIHAWSERHSSTYSSPFIPTSLTLFSPSSSSSYCCLSTSTKLSSNTMYSTNKDFWSTDESYSNLR